MSLRNIGAVPSAAVLIDTCLGATNRRTPTVIRKHYEISRIRSFYMRKVKHAAKEYTERLDNIIDSFPKIDEVHPFLSDLINVLYDRDHYKMSLGHLRVVSTAIANTDKEYTRLLKYGDSLFRCKQLKRAALGKMSTMAKKLGKSLAYLEEVRQNFTRIPDIDPTTRTLLICGYPNVGKSSFMNTVTRARVDVQPYAFTTKNLYVGHFDYKHLRWQVIDTPGILDHPIEERNTIEMQSITALAHLRACILYFLDLSETCGYSIGTQLSLYKSLIPLFANKPVVFVLSKADIARLEDLSGELRSEVLAVVGDSACSAISSLTEENIDATKNLACENLLQQRVEAKLQKERMGEFRNMLEISVPSGVDPEEKRRAHPEEFGVRATTEKEIEKLALEGGKKYFPDLNKHYFIRDEWKYDVIPEILNGKNIADFIDRDIEEKILRLEQEEEYYQDNVYGKSYSLMDPEELQLKQKIEDATSKRKKIGMLNSRTRVPERLKLQALYKKKRRDTRLEREGDAEGRAEKGSEPELMDVEGAAEEHRGLVTKISERDQKKLGAVTRKIFATKLRGKKGESDRRVLTAKPKHLFSGKRGIGKAQRR